MVLKEAIACELPVVGVRVGDVQDKLSGVEGYAFWGQKLGEIGSQLIRLLSAEKIAGRRAIIQGGLDLESVARRVLAVYQKALSQTSKSPITKAFTKPNSGAANH